MEHKWPGWATSGDQMRRSGFDFNRCTIGHGAPDLINFLVRYRNAAVSPILQPVTAADPAITVGKPVQVNVAARRDPEFFRASTVLRIWIRDVNRPVELTVSVPAIQNVDAFRRSVITLADFWACWFSA